MLTKNKLLGVLVVATVIGAGLWLSVSQIEADKANADRQSLQTTLREYAATAATGGCESDSPAVFQPAFPRDFAPHSDAQSEYWGLTTVLHATTGERFALRLNLVRIAVTGCDVTLPDSAWAYSHVMGVSAMLFDVSDSQSHSHEQLARVAQGLAGASDKRVWVDRWSIDTVRAGQCALQLTVAVPVDATNLDLSIAASQCPSWNGASEDGGSALQNLNGYVVPGFSVTGTATREDIRLQLSGHGWLERFWGQIPAVATGPVVWDRLTFAAADHTDPDRVMPGHNEPTHRHISLLRSRRRDGTGTPILSGLVIETDGTQTVLDNDDIAFTPYTKKRLFGNPETGWTLDIPGIDLRASINPLLANTDSGDWSGLIKIQYNDHEFLDYGIFDLAR